MKKRLVSVLLAAGMLALCACGYNPGLFTSQRPPGENGAGEMSTIYRNAIAEYKHMPVTPAHGEDYVIEWEDAGMEAHVRTWLDRPQGDIYHSDVWDYQYLDIVPYLPSREDYVLTKPVEGEETLAGYSASNTERNEVKDKKTRVEIPIKSLRDLRHFDSLVVLCFSYGTAVCPEPITDISGIEALENLTSISMEGAEPDTLEPIAALDKLISLHISCTAETDLSSLAGLPSLEWLSLTGSEIASLEALADMPRLRILDLTVSNLPSLEPLAQTNIEYLDAGVQMGFGDHEMDFASLAAMPKLYWLSLSNRNGLDFDTCANIIEAAPSLKYLDINNTEAAKRIGELDTSDMELVVGAATNI